jgi:hypothetical protein
MAVWKVKNCPRCGGDMFIDRDIYGWYEKCLQCGYCCELRDLDEFKQGTGRKNKRFVVASGHNRRGR